MSSATNNGAMSATTGTMESASQVKTGHLMGAYWALLAFYVIYCARPEDWIPGLAYVPLAKITGGLAAVVALMTLGSGSRKLPREVLYLALLIAQFWLAVPFSPVWRGGAFWSTLGFSKLLLIFPAMILVTQTLSSLRRLIFVQAGSTVLVALASIALNARASAGRLTGAENGQYGNPNDLATALSIALPFCFAFLLKGRGVLRKVAWGVSIVAMIYAVILTESRSGLLAVVLSMGFCLWELGVKGGRRYLIALSALVVLVFAIIAGKGLKARFAATFGSEVVTQEEETAHESALERREMLKDSIILTLQHPLFGVGANNFTPTTQHWRETHNDYTQMSCEGGIPALILFLMILWRAFRNLRETNQAVPKNSEEALWAGTLHASFLGFLAGAFFSSVAYLYYPYFLVGYTSILRSLVSSPEGAPPQPAPVKPREKLDQTVFIQGRAAGL